MSKPSTKLALLVGGNDALEGETEHECSKTPPKVIVFDSEVFDNEEVVWQTVKKLER